MQPSRPKAVRLHKRGGRASKRRHLSRSITVGPTLTAQAHACTSRCEGADEASRGEVAGREAADLVIAAIEVDAFEAGPVARNLGQAAHGLDLGGAGQHAQLGRDRLRRVDQAVEDIHRVAPTMARRPLAEGR